MIVKIFGCQISVDHGTLEHLNVLEIFLLGVKKPGDTGRGHVPCTPEHQ